MQSANKRAEWLFTLLIKHNLYIALYIEVLIAYDLIFFKFYNRIESTEFYS